MPETPNSTDGNFHAAQAEAILHVLATGSDSPEQWEEAKRQALHILGMTPDDVQAPAPQPEAPRQHARGDWLGAIQG